MDKYKVVCSKFNTPKQLEDELNRAAQQGYRIKTILNSNIIMELEEKPKCKEQLS